MTCTDTTKKAPVKFTLHLKVDVSCMYPGTGTQASCLMHYHKESRDLFQDLFIHKHARTGLQGDMLYMQIIILFFLYGCCQALHTSLLTGLLVYMSFFLSARTCSGGLVRKPPASACS